MHPLLWRKVSEVEAVMGAFVAVGVGGGGAGGGAVDIGLVGNGSGGGKCGLFV